MTDAKGWRALAAPDGVRLWRRRMPDDPNVLYRWHLPEILAPADRVAAALVDRVLDFRDRWDASYLGGDVVEAGSGHRVLHQRFRPAAGTRRRDVCAVEIVRRRQGATLASYRSIDALPPAAGFQRADVWAAILVRPVGDGRCEVFGLEREDHGGWVPAWLVNGRRGRRILARAQGVVRLFADGGPAEIVADRARRSGGIE